ncbi:hypothetical protein DPMN_112701 [Dreissena polymorpha]|uniref:Uncharacterized protein n=1 Tax=Dreissena polymorpha TaxID=45954 RepID=A0A9D4KGT3_DREPO|nr:hypothetical protein DPMN_112701 [Dreissena polymorpha]
MQCQFCSSSDESKWKNFPNPITPYLGYSNWRDRAIGYAPYPRSAFVHGTRPKPPYSATVYGDHLPRGYGPNESLTQGSERRPSVVSMDLPDHLRNLRKCNFWQFMYAMLLELNMCTLSM